MEYNFARPPLAAKLWWSAAPAVSARLFLSIHSPERTGFRPGERCLSHMPPRRGSAPTGGYAALPKRACVRSSSLSCQCGWGCQVAPTFASCRTAEVYVLDAAGIFALSRLGNLLPPAGSGSAGVTQVSRQLHTLSCYSRENLKYGYELPAGLEPATYSPFPLREPRGVALSTELRQFEK